MTGGKGVWPLDTQIKREPPEIDSSMVVKPPDVDPGLVQEPPMFLQDVSPSPSQRSTVSYPDENRQSSGLPAGPLSVASKKVVAVSDSSELKQPASPRWRPATSGASSVSGFDRQSKGGPPGGLVMVEAPVQIDSLHIPSVERPANSDTKPLPRPPPNLDLPPIEDIRAAAARLLVFGFNGKRMNAHARRLIILGAGGVVLFSRNFEDPEQVARLCLELKRAAAPRPFIIMIDQEGGGVVRLGAPFTPIPWAKIVGSTRDPDAAEVAGCVIGRELRAVYIDMNLAPVVDVDTNPDNPVIGRRSFGSDPQLVGAMGFSFVRGLQKEGVAACIKHFPGHGDTSVDSHLDLPYVNHSIERLEAVELVPFKKIVDADVAAVLVAHVAVPALDEFPEDAGRPATMSRGAIQYLREHVKFEGVVLSDCMEMGAVMKHFSSAEAAVLAVSAGIELLLFCHTEDRQLSAVEGLVSAVLTGRLPYGQLEKAGKRIADFAKYYVRGPPNLRKLCDEEYFYDRLETIGSKEHQDMVANIMHQAAAMGMA